MTSDRQGIRINGLAHVSLTVNDVSRSARFYRPLLQFMGLTPVSDSGAFLYCVGGRTAIGLQPPVAVDKNYQFVPPAGSTTSSASSAASAGGDRFRQTRVGLHHLCFRLYSRDDVDTLHAFVKELPLGSIVSAPAEGPWAPGYYYFVFEDPDGIRLEANFVPNKGLLGLKRKKIFSKM